MKILKRWVMLMVLVPVWATAEAEQYVCEDDRKRVHLKMTVENEETGVPCSLSSRTDYDDDWYLFLHQKAHPEICRERLELVLSGSQRRGLSCRLVDQGAGN